MVALALSGWLVLLAEIARWRRNSELGFGSFLVFLIVGFLVVRVALSFTSWGDSRDFIRGKALDARRPTLEAALDDVLKRQKDAKQPVIVIVAAAGGGIRASYFTSLVLARATDRMPSLKEKIILASGVSGGSLGLAVYRSLFAVKDPKCPVPDREGKLKIETSPTTENPSLNLRQRVPPRRFSGRSDRSHAQQ